MAAAIERAGGQEELRALVEREGLFYRNAKSVSDWKTKGNAPGSVLFAMAQALPGLSLDEYALGEQAQRSLAARVDELREEIEYLKVERDEVRQRLGMPPYPVRERRREATGEVS